MKRKTPDGRHETVERGKKPIPPMQFEKLEAQRENRRPKKRNRQHGRPRGRRCPY